MTESEQRITSAITIAILTFAITIIVLMFESTNSRLSNIEHQLREILQRIAALEARQ